MVYQLADEGLTPAQADRLIHIAADLYSRDNPIQIHFNISYAESIEFFTGYIKNADLVAIAIDTKDNIKLFWAHVCQKLSLECCHNVTNWGSTPAIKHCIELLKRIFEDFDQSKILRGKITFAKAVFVDRAYRGAIKPQLMFY